MQIDLTVDETEVILWMLDVINEIDTYVPTMATFSECIPKQMKNSMDSVFIKLGGSYV
jgi:hypothetical protein